jgi:NADH:ubiquinone oxidoreductase subunit 6 (subunit J)
MDFATLMFWIFAVILVGSALMVVGMRNIVHSALALVVLFAMASGIFVLLNAQFIAIVQILIYAGAVTILILFALMLTRIQGQPRTNPTNKLWFIALLICLVLCVSIIYAVIGSQHLIGAQQTATNQVPTQPNNVVSIGQLLYSPTTYSYVLPFEIASLVLLVAIVGAIIIGREEE